MSSAPAIDEDLIRRLPLPLAQLYRRAHNAKTPLERHLTAFYLWEAGLKFLASVAIVEYARQGLTDPQLAERLQNLARPALGHWWEFIRRLTPVLADQGHESFQKVRELLLGRRRDDCPRAAGMDAALREALGGRSSAQATVRFTELFDRMVQYRNQVLAHAAPGQLKDDFNEGMGRAILAGVAEIFNRLDMTAGRRLLYIAEVRQVAGAWMVERQEMVGETARRIASLELPRDAALRLPDAERLYFDDPASLFAGQDEAIPAPDPLASLGCLHPLVIYDADAEEVLFLNARRGRQRTEYLCYTTGRTLERTDLGGERRELLARVLGMAVDAGQMEQWEARSQAEEPPEDQEAAVRSPEAVRRTLGEFELLAELGRGGMGVVYRAWQPSLGRQVALKKLLHTGDTKAEARFRREIRALGGVEHPHIVKVYTSGSEGTEWFYAMELVEGATLASVAEHLRNHTPSAAAIDQKTWQEALSTSCEETRKKEKPIGSFIPEHPKPAPPVEPWVAPALGSSGYVRCIVELIRQAAEAAHALHATGVIHRDIKPGNILVKSDGAQAVLMDLGLAQLADEMEGRLTRTRQFVGTLRYASPEQVLAVDRLDARSDVYSLGATLWELLTLRPMFGATEETPTPKLMRSIEFDEPEPIRKYHPGIAPDLEAIVMKCLEKDPGHRYASAKELADDLDRWLHNEPVHAQRSTRGYRLRKFVRRNRERLSVATLLVLLLAVIVGMGYHLFRKVEVVRSEPTTPAHKIPIGTATTKDLTATKDSAATVHLLQPDSRAYGGVTPRPAAGNRYALLIGCTDYPRTEGFFKLEGPGNDVVLMHKVLTQKFGLSKDRIVTLADASESAERKPTRENIEREVRRLGDIAQASDQVVIYLGGYAHSRPGRGLSTPGVEELFLPIDSQRVKEVFLSSDTQRPIEKTYLVNAISSKEFSDWIYPITAKKASLWVIYDSNYGGFGLAEQRDLEKPGLVFTYAARPGEQSFERLLPPENPNPVRHGLFTYALCQILSQAEKSLTYDELIQQVNDQYVARGRTREKAWAAGEARGDIVMEGIEKDALPIQVTRHLGGKMKLNGGAGNGFTIGSILAVKSLQDQDPDTRIVGYVRITTLENDTATVEPCEFAGRPPPERLLDAGRCQFVFVAGGNLRVKVGIADRTEADEPVSASQGKQLGDELEKLAKDQGSLVEFTRYAREAAWLVVPVPVSAKSRNVYLYPAIDGKPDPQTLVVHEYGSLTFEEEEPRSIGPIPVDKVALKLKEILNRMARVQNLLALSNFPRITRDKSGSDIQLNLVKLRNEKDSEGQTILGSENLPLGAGDWVGFRVMNSGQQPVDITLLRVKADGGIECIFPRSNDPDNRLDPGGKPILLKTRIANGFSEFEHAVLIATKANSSFGQHVNFSFLAEPILDAAREVAQKSPGGLASGFDTPFGKFLRNRFYTDGDSHGLTTEEIKPFIIKKLSWRVERPMLR